VQIPSDAPFSEAQRAWLNGFLAGLFSPGLAAFPAAPFASVESGQGTPAVGVVGTASVGNLGQESATGNTLAAYGTAATGTHYPSATYVEAPYSEAQYASGQYPGAPPTTGPYQSPSHYSANNPYAARILELAPSEELPDAWHIVLDTEGSGLTFRAGDLLGVFPANEPDLVRRVLRQLGARGQETVTTSRGTSPIWKVLLEELDLQCVTPELVWLVSSCARNPDEAQHLEGIARSARPPEGNVFAFLRRFPSAKPLIGEFASVLSPLVPRVFPVAVAGSRHSSSVEALLSGTQGSVLTEIRDGRLKAGDWLPIFVHSRPVAHPPNPDETPVILLAAGSAIASAHAFIVDRSTTRTRARNWVFVSADPSTSTFPYARQFSAWQTSRTITRLDVATGAQLLERFRNQFDMIQRWLTDRSAIYAFLEPTQNQEFVELLTTLFAERTSISVDEAKRRVESLRNTGQLRLISS
jgi:sulfite reductase (NADPH) flavoprotein alpha-component